MTEKDRNWIEGMSFKKIYKKPNLDYYIFANDLDGLYD